MHGTGVPWYSGILRDAEVLLDYRGHPKSTMMAYNTMTSILDSSVPAVSLYEQNLVALMFKKEHETIAVAWGAKPLSVLIPGIKVYNMMGNRVLSPTCLRDEPVFIMSDNTNPGRLLSTLEHLNRAESEIRQTIRSMPGRSEGVKAE